MGQELLSNVEPRHLVHERGGPGRRDPASRQTHRKESNHLKPTCQLPRSVPKQGSGAIPEYRSRRTRPFVSANPSRSPVCRWSWKDKFAAHWIGTTAKTQTENPKGSASRPGCRVRGYPGTEASGSTTPTGLRHSGTDGFCESHISLCEHWDVNMLRWIRPSLTRSVFMEKTSFSTSHMHGPVKRVNSSVGAQVIAALWSAGAERSGDPALLLLPPA